jgi:hypothetical protein
LACQDCGYSADGYNLKSAMSKWVECMQLIERHKYEDSEKLELKYNKLLYDFFEIDS